MNDERAPWGPFDLDAWQGFPREIAPNELGD